ncbi:hypothetical protein B0H10DRAFT_1959348 [Mycena sp. CBHHK59/15]|nr:hypothetical protein B0H10DRAFT_1959348 [Mycena sp. CBHHK59/15]
MPGSSDGSAIAADNKYGTPKAAPKRQRRCSVWPNLCEHIHGEIKTVICVDFAYLRRLFQRLEGTPEDVQLVQGPPFDLQKWFAKHGAELTRPIIDSVVAALREEGVTTSAATGYSRYVVDLAFNGVIQVSAISHPSLLVIPDDLKKYRDVAKAPLLINSCTVDSLFPLEAQAQADDILGGGKFAPGYQREYFDGCQHGFAVRGNMSDPKVKAGRRARSNGAWSGS